MSAWGIFMLKYLDGERKRWGQRMTERGVNIRGRWVMCTSVCLLNTYLHFWAHEHHRQWKSINNCQIIKKGPLLGATRKPLERSIRVHFNSFLCFSFFFYQSPSCLLVWKEAFPKPLLHCLSSFQFSHGREGAHIITITVAAIPLEILGHLKKMGS